MVQSAGMETLATVRRVKKDEFSFCDGFKLFLQLLFLNFVAGPLIVAYLIVLFLIYLISFPLGVFLFPGCELGLF